MAQRTVEIVLVLAAVAMLFVGQASAQTGCTTALVGLIPCLTYITGNSSTPSQPCCSQLASVVQSQPQCLCMVVNGAAVPSLGITLNNTRTMALPAACNVKTPSVTQCNAVAGGPAASPTESPRAAAAAPSPASSTTPSTPTPTTPSTPSNPSPETPSTRSTTPSVPSAPAGSTGSKTTPSTVTDTSDACSKKYAMAATASLILITAFAAVSNF